MITPTVFWTGVTLAAILGFFMGYFTVRSINGILLGITIGIFMAFFCGGIVGIFLDDAISQTTATTSVVNLTIVDTFQGTGFLGGNDLTIKLSDGKILHFEDPYEWKKFNSGDKYNFTRIEWVSIIYGTRRDYDYRYLGVV